MEKDKEKEKQTEAPHFILTADDPCAVQGLKAYGRLLSEPEQVRAVKEVIKAFQAFLKEKESATESAENTE